MSEPEMDELIAELDRTNKTLYVIISVVGLLLLMGGAVNILDNGINLVNGVCILFGGFTSYKWHQSDKYKKSLRERLRKKGDEF